jgi:pimeloyl-ACP methyl ester carboxylesterase
VISTASDSGYAPVNGLDIYYETHGRGDPLVLLHGGMGSTATFERLAPALSASKRVIAIDLQAHGRTADIDQPLRYERMADDVAGVLSFLHIDEAAFMGYSLGAGVALQTAVRHPNMVQKLVAVSAPFSPRGWYPEIFAAIAHMGPATAEAMKQSPLYRRYAAVAPRPQDWPVLHSKLPELLSREYDWSQAIAAIKAPVLLVFADADSIRPSHMVEFYKLLGGGRRDGGWDGSGMPSARLAVLPGRTHYDIMDSPLLGAAVSDFLGQHATGRSSP